MTKREILLALSVIIVGAFVSHAEESLRSVDPDDGWKFATKSNDVTIYSRVRAGSPLKEFKAVGGIDAPVATPPDALPATAAELLERASTLLDGGG